MDIRPMTGDDFAAVARLYLSAYKSSWSEHGVRKYLEKFFGFEPESCFVELEPDGSVSRAVHGYSIEK
jgi:hypothetical protein